MTQRHAFLLIVCALTTLQASAAPEYTPDRRTAHQETFLEALEEQKLEHSLGECLTFGIAVALEGDTALIGCNNPGAAYVFTRVGGIWSESARLTASDHQAFNGFGGAVVLQGNTAVIGATSGIISSAVYVFTRTGEIWTEQAKLVSPEPQTDARFGGSIALDGDTMLVGAPHHSHCGNDDYYASQCGTAYVFTRAGDVWSERAKLVRSDPSSSESFGNAVALDGGTALVGAYRVSINSHQIGAAYVFTGGGSSWSERAKLVASDYIIDNYMYLHFGTALDLEGGTALIGGDYAAYVFTGVGSNWSEQAMFRSPSGSGDLRLGNAVALDGGTALIGAWRNDQFGPDSGAVYIFTGEGADWSEPTKLTASDAAEDGLFGGAVALDGDTMLIGGRSDGNGRVYAYGPVTSDVDGNGFADALTDGLLIIRHLFGFSGSALTDGAIAGDCTRCDAIDIAAHIDQINERLDVDGNGETAALTDGLLIIRCLFGFTGTTLTDGAVGPGCTLCTPAEINAYCATLVH